MIEMAHRCSDDGGPTVLLYIDVFKQLMNDVLVPLYSKDKQTSSLHGRQNVYLKFQSSEDKRIGCLSQKYIDDGDGIMVQKKVPFFSIHFNRKKN